MPSSSSDNDCVCEKCTPKQRHSRREPECSCDKCRKRYHCRKCREQPCSKCEFSRKCKYRETVPQNKEDETTIQVDESRMNIGQHITIVINKCTV